MGTGCTCAIMAMARIVVIQVILQAILAVETSININNNRVLLAATRFTIAVLVIQAVIMRDVTVVLIASLSITMRNSKQQHH